MANITLKHIYKVYPNGTKAVNDFNMEIEDKEFIVFVGPSGCGKSTTLRMIAGLEEITVGELRIGDRVVNEVEPKDRDIAMVFQNYALYPHMTVYENMAFALQVRKMPKQVLADKWQQIFDEMDENRSKLWKSLPFYFKAKKAKKAIIKDKVESAAEILSITEYLGKKPKEMSGGQRQRVSLGRAIVREPKVMLLDEPLSNLDAKLRTQMRSEISKLHEKLATTFVYVTHDQVEAMTMGTRIVVMKDGFVKQIDTPKNLYMHPSNKFVAGFIGAPQMNFLNCHLEEREDRVYLVAEDIGQEIMVDKQYLAKIDYDYIKYQKPIILGLRAEDLSFSDYHDSSASFDVKVSHAEELGTETLVYCDCSAQASKASETVATDSASVQLIVKASAFLGLQHNFKTSVNINLENMHLFDRETEENIIPLLPKTNKIVCNVANNAIVLADQTISLPPAVAISDGEVSLTIPTNAVMFDGDIPAQIVECEKVDKVYLAKIAISDKLVYAISESDLALGETKIGLDFKNIVAEDGEKVVHQSMQNMFSFEGKLVLEKQNKSNDGDIKKGSKRYSININGQKFDCSDDLLEKLFASMSGRKIFNTVLRFEFSPYDIVVKEDGIETSINSICDYGTEKFAVCNVLGKEVSVHIEDLSVLKSLNEESETRSISVALDFSKASVVETKRDIRLV